MKQQQQQQKNHKGTRDSRLFFPSAIADFNEDPLPSPSSVLFMHLYTSALHARSVGLVVQPSHLAVRRRGQGGGRGLDGGGVRLLPHGVGLGNIDTWGVGLGVAGTVVVGHRLAHRSHFRLVSVCNTSPSFRTNKSSACTVNLKRKSRFLRVQGSCRFLETKLKDFSMTLNFPYPFFFSFQGPPPPPSPPSKLS